VVIPEIKKKRADFPRTWHTIGLEGPSPLTGIVKREKGPECGHRCGARITAESSVIMGGGGGGEGGGVWGGGGGGGVGRSSV